MNLWLTQLWFDYRFNYSSFWWPDMKKDLRIISPDAPNANSTDLPLGLTPHFQSDPFPQLHFPSNAGESISMDHGETKNGTDNETDGTSISHKYFWLFGLELTLLLGTRHLPIFGTHPRLPNDETPPRSSLMPLDEIERMEENSEFIARS
ncbi:hypothetical protein BASA83_013201 [Batrachochytrium salamandrivorans]|nr:hypothetical protein BASA83_013201 [Batrachochytrium salamandrivorans]